MQSRIYIPRRRRIRLPNDMAPSKTSFALYVTCENVFSRMQDTLHTLQCLLAHVSAGFTGDRQRKLFRTAYLRTGTLTDRAMTQSDAWRLLQRPACEAGFPTAVRNNTFRAIGITAYLDNGGFSRTLRLWPPTRVLAPRRFTVELTT